MKDFVYLVQDRKTLIVYGVFSTEKIALKHIKGNLKYFILKCKID